jgi:hypothetical protein
MPAGLGPQTDVVSAEYAQLLSPSSPTTSLRGRRSSTGLLAAFSSRSSSGSRSAALAGTGNAHGAEAGTGGLASRVRIARRSSTGSPLISASNKMSSARLRALLRAAIQLPARPYLAGRVRRRVALIRASNSSMLTMA